MIDYPLQGVVNHEAFDGPTVIGPRQLLADENVNEDVRVVPGDDADGHVRLGTLDDTLILGHDRLTLHIS